MNDGLYAIHLYLLLTSKWAYVCTATVMFANPALYVCSLFTHNVSGCISHPISMCNVQQNKA